MEDNDTALAVNQPSHMLQIIDKVVQSGLTAESVGVLEKMLNMQERIMADQRKTAFTSALARLQAKVPQVNKYGQGKNSKYAKYEDIDLIVRPLMAEEGFSLTFDEESSTDKTITFVAVLIHSEGHSEPKRLTVPIDVAAMNREGRSVRPAIQDAGSTVSYARRYLLKMHLNIVEKDEDDDGAGSEAKITAEQAKDIRTLIHDSKSDEKKFLELIAGVQTIEDIPARDLKRILNALETKLRVGK